MGDPREAASRRLLSRVLKRLELTESNPPSDTEWPKLLDVVRALLADQEQERYLLERSLANSSQEMLALNQDLRATAEQVVAEHRDLATANSVLAATLESTADGILVVCGDGHISSFNGRFVQMWGLSEELLRAGDNAALSIVVSQLKDPEAFLSKLDALYQTPEAASRDTLEFKDGKVFERRSLPQELDGEIIGRVWSFRDVTAEQRLRSELQHRALHDSLTGLANRAAFDDHLHKALGRQGRTRGHLAAVVVDLDGFKHINDSMGHQSGDAVLIAVAERFRSCFPDLDTIARLGGDEFAMLVDEVSSPEEAARLGQLLLDVLAEPIELGARQVTLSGSIGITIADGDTADAAQVLAQADAAMYRAKRDGKGRYRLFEASIHARAVERLGLGQALRRAVRDDELTVHYQPIVDARSGRVVSFEALARWHDPIQGDVAPDTFIPIAEETGLIHDIGRAVLRSGCRQAQKWQTSHPHRRLGIAVNVSTRQLLEPTYGQAVRDALAKSGLDPHCLTLEVTESAFQADTGCVISTLEGLRSLGVRVAIDDFGTGYCSFATLGDLPVDTIKIDKSFVDKLHDPRGHGLVQAIIGIAATLGLGTVAEGVEAADQRESLLELNCTQLQGYLFARPMRAEETYAFLRQPPGPSGSCRAAASRCATYSCDAG